jgi:hypothetical protein
MPGIKTMRARTLEDSSRKGSETQSRQRLNSLKNSLASCVLKGLGGCSILTSRLCEVRGNFRDSTTTLNTCGLKGLGFRRAVIPKINAALLKTG